MSAVVVSRGSLGSGDLPRVCVKTGAPADGTVDVRFSRLPPWTYLLLLAGIFPFLVALLFADEVVTGRLPVHRVVFERYRRLSRWAWTCLGVALLAAATASLGGGWWLWWGAAALVAGGSVTFMWREVGWVSARPLRGGSSVKLVGVAPRFAEEVEGMLTAR